MPFDFYIHNIDIADLYCLSQNSVIIMHEELSSSNPYQWISMSPTFPVPVVIFAASQREDLAVKVASTDSSIVSSSIITVCKIPYVDLSV